jgi:hypothetical protein
MPKSVAMDLDALEHERIRVNAIGESRGFGDSEYLRDLDLLTREERQFARLHGLPYARSVDLGAVWEPNDPDPRWWETGASAFLSLLPHFDDQDRRRVEFEWIGWERFEIVASHRLMSHPLWQWGLRSCLWGAEALGGYRDGSVSRHFLLNLGDRFIEISAEGWSMDRNDKS